LEVTAGCSALLGVSLHQIFRILEVDSRGWELVFTYVSGVTVLFIGYASSTSLGTAGSLLRSWLAGTAFLVGLYGSMLLYRAFFHRLRRFSGPFAARLSNAYQ
jgi:hypothetical protein